MTDNRAIRACASAAIVALTLPPLAIAAEPSSGPAATAPALAQQGPVGMTTPRSAAETRRAAMDAERDKRYAELRTSAAQLGVDLPETPPWASWETNMPRMPMRPQMPDDYGRPSPEEREAMLERREAMREQRWRQMQAEASERGMDWPQTPPWEAMKERRQAMDERMERYRATIGTMNEEQREAARAVYGSAPSMPYPSMPPRGYESNSWEHNCPVESHGAPYRRMMPRYYGGPGYGQGAFPPPARTN